MRILKKNYKLLIGIIIGSIITGTSVYAATVLTSNQVSYDNTNSKLSSTNVKDALDELAKNTELRNRSKIVEGYTYNSSTCVTGEESTCVKTDCYKDTTANSCKAGDIIKYKVNDTDIVTFHVMYDNGSTLTMQSQKNIINNTPWMSASDYATYNTDGTSCSSYSCKDEGPMTVLIALERATKSWTNVNNQTYTMGTTIFQTNSFTDCISYDSCIKNSYTLPSRSAKARLITLQETAYFGCLHSVKTCPNWMNNYLYDSEFWGGTVSDNSSDSNTGAKNYGYWTMNGHTEFNEAAWAVDCRGYVTGAFIFDTDTLYGARAVVEITK